MPLAPKKVPDLARGAASYGQNCTGCHGEVGDGRGPDAAKLDPPPVAFTDAERGRQRSVFALYQVITQGLDGTAMASFEGLPPDDRWALAFYAGVLPDGPLQRTERGSRKARRAHAAGQGDLNRFDCPAATARPDDGRGAFGSWTESR